MSCDDSSKGDWNGVVESGMHKVQSRQLDIDDRWKKYKCQCVSKLILCSASKFWVNICISSTQKIRDF